MSIRLPESLHRQARELAKREGISINQLVTSALAEKISALMTEEYLQVRSEAGNRERFERALAKVPENEPEECDRLE